jgi:xylulose-5-phosphate/fructose-6-phosphate phosphoketolase
MSGPKYLDGLPIEGSWRAHQVPLAAPATVPEQFDLLENWLKSYRPAEIFDAKPNVLEMIDRYIIPSDPAKRMGQRKETYGLHYHLDMPAWEPLGLKKGSEASATKVTGKYLTEVFEKFVPSIFQRSAH